MNVGILCKEVPAYLPHELLGYSKDDLQGTLLSMSLISKVNEREKEMSKESNVKQSNRINKFKRLK